MHATGFETRPLTLDDAGRYTDAVNAISAHIGIKEKIEPSWALLEWEEPGFDLGSSSLGVFDAKGLLAGYAIFWATSDTPVHPTVDWGVRPDFHAAELEKRLLEWAEAKAAGVIERCPAEARVSLRSATYLGFAFEEKALDEAGFKPRRHWFDMQIDLTERPAPPPLPAGFHPRPYRPEVDLPILVDVVRDSFSDHFGYIEQPFEKSLELFRHWLDNDPRFDPELVMLAADETSGDVAGCLIGLTQDHRKPDAGYVDTVGVRRAYRRRGLATAMLKRSFAQFWDRGTKIVRLDVDGESLTNAVALYERVGMRVFRQNVEYEKLIREGVELEKVAMD